MLCEVCGKNEANIHRIIVINGAKHEQHVCAECAKSTGFVIKLPSLAALSQQEDGKLPHKACECGTTMKRILETGLVGCEKCYSTFRDELLPVIKSAQGGRTMHKGTRPESYSYGSNGEPELVRLRRELSEAVSREEYEKAAVLRDRINELSGKEGAK